MIDPNSPEYAAWYESQVACIRRCEEWCGEIRALHAKRALVDGAQRISLMSHHRLQGYTTKTELATHFEDRGPEMRSFARSATRDELAKRVIQDRLDAIDTEIARLEQLIVDNQPSPLWRERKEETSDTTHE